MKGHYLFTAKSCGGHANQSQCSFASTVFSFLTMEVRAYSLTLTRSFLMASQAPLV